MCLETNRSNFANLIRYGLDLDLAPQKWSILLGAGASLNSGLPLANQYLAYLLKHIGCTPKEIATLMSASVPFELVLQHAISFRSSCSTELIKLFSNPLFPPNRNHYITAILAKSGIITHIFTVNFDTLIEQALNAIGLKEQVDYFVSRTESEFEAQRPAKAIHLIKLHGSADYPDSVRITLDSICKGESLHKRQAGLAKMTDPKDIRSLIVLGYSCSDAFDITPFLRDTATKQTQIAYVFHSSQEPLYSVRNLVSSESNHAFHKHPGHQIRCNTDIFVDALAETFDIHLPPNSPPPEKVWERHIETYTQALTPNKKLILKGQLLAACGRHIDAFHCFAGVTAEVDDPFENARALHRIARSRKNQNRLDEAASLYRISIHHYASSIVSYRGIPPLALAYANTNEEETLSEFLRRVTNLTKSWSHETNFPFDTGVPSILGPIMEVCSILIEQGDQVEALFHLETILEVAEEQNRSDLAAAILNEIAMAQIHLSQFEKAEENLRRSLKIKIDHGNISGAANTIDNLVVLLVKSGNTAEGMRYLIESFSIRNKIGDIRKSFSTFTNILRAFELQNDFAGGVRFAIEHYSFVRLALDETHRSRIDVLIMGARGAIDAPYTRAQTSPRALDDENTSARAMQSILKSIHHTLCMYI